MVKTNLVFSTVTLITFLGLAKGTITSPPDGKRFVFLPGTSHRIICRYNNISAWRWSFTPRGSSSPQQIARLFANSYIPDYLSRPFAFEVFKPGTLRLKNVNQSYNGELTFRIITTPPTPPSKANVYIAVKPTVSINCSSPLFVNESDNASCVCRGEGGNPPANVTWFDKDNTTVRGFGVENATLVITGASPNDRGSYKCKAESFDDPRFIDEKSIEIKVNYQPRSTNITLSKKNPQVGESVNITCESDGFPPPTFIISYNGAVLSNNKTYIIQSLNFNHAGSYRCEAKNKLGNDLSDVKNLTIIRGKILSPPPGTSFTFLPGKTRNITWTFDDDLNDVASRDWFFTGSSNGSQSTLLATAFLDLPLIKHNAPILPNYDVYKPSTLRLRNITHSYDGTYEFRLTRKDSLLSPFISKVRVFVAIKPNATINCSTPLVVSKGDNVSCVCRGEGGNPPANVTWFDKDNTTVREFGVESATLVITNASPNDRGSYRCKAESFDDPRFIDEKSIEIQVKFKPIVSIDCSSPLFVNESDNVSCVCRGEGGIPPANITWFDKDNNIIGDVGVVSKTLVIPGASPNDRGSYRCKAESFNNPRFINEKSIEIKVNYQPRTTTITLSKINAKIGESMNITCESDGFPLPTFIIYHNGAVISNNKKYIIQSVNFNNAGSYRCEAKNKLGNNLSDVKNLTIIKVKPTVVINCSTPLVVDEGDNVSCVCRGEGGNPPANVTWFDKDNNIIGDVGVVSKTLVITNVTVNDGGIYRCKAQSHNDQHYRDEKSIEITVTPTYRPHETNITISPMTVKKGQTVTITCESDGYPEPTYTIYHNGAVISNNKTYIIQSVNFNNAGSYRCEAKNKLRNDLSDVKNLTIIRVKPTVVINCSTPLVVNEGDNVSCVCRGEGGIPPANVTWFDKDNNIIGDVGVVSKTLVITNVTLNDGGNYTCKAQSYNDQRYRDEKSIEVTVTPTYPPQQTNITISPMSLKKGQTVTITCESDGYPEPTYTIYHNGAVISNNKTYIIQSVNFNNAGSYRCEAKNILGNDLSYVKNLTIITVKPNVVINCSNPLVVNEGDNVSCVCRGEGGNPPANVTWFDKDNNIIGDVGVVSNTLVITNVAVNDGGRIYKCEAQSYDDTDYRDEKSIEIQVKSKPTVLINCSNPLVVNEGDNVSCVCRGEGGNPPANVTWFDKDNNIIDDVGVVSKTLVITNVTVNDGGNYRCKAQSYNDPRFRDEKSIEVTVKATYPPQQTNITISPMSVKKGQNVTITCESDGYPEPTYTIYHNGAVISNNKTYIIQSVNFNNAGSYRCEAKNRLGNDSSQVKNLTIIRVKPTVVINCSTPLVVDEGDNVSCVCRGEGGIPPANVTWFDKHNNIINDGGNYTCKAQSYNDPRFRDEKSIEVTVKAAYPPQQTNITISPMSVKKGQNVTITCESDGYPEPTYTIYHNGAVISNNKTYIIQSVNFNNAGSYRCEAKNRLGNDSSQVKNLTIIRDPPQQTNITISPMSVKKGQNVTITCESDGYPEPTYTIYHNVKPTVVINCSTPLVVDEGDNVSCVCRVNDGGNYTCKAQSYNDPRFRDEKSIEVTVKATYPPQQTNITISPMSVKKGQNVTITCESDGYPEPTYTIYHNGAVISNNKTYIIQSVNFNNAGSYRCEAKNKLGNDLSDVKNLTIIRVKPTVVINCSTPLVVDEGDNVSCVCRGEGDPPQQTNITISPMSVKKGQNVTITCESDGYPEPTYTIYHNGAVISNNKTYIIQSVNFNNAGSYRCEAKNKLGNDLSDVKNLTIIRVKPTVVINCSTPLVVNEGDNVSCVCKGEGDPPQQTNITISPMSVKKGQNVTITCESDGYPEPTYTIYHNGAVISNNKTYIIQSVNFNNAGSYRCEAKNRLGNDSSQVKNLTIIRVKPTVVINCSTPLVVDEGDNVSCVCRDPPQQTNITISPMSVKKGQNVTITCESDGYPEPTYTIYHNGAVISNNKTYIIQSVNFNNAGSYRCEAKNRLGNDSSQVKNLTIIRGYQKP
ncbi:hemicentin-1-like [Xenia sp. Carnegie-2017]|uniref:hemicentin-1-like n=1 Tax=Xenia sp. Carnegie-2017 TaxID=2897299 RepID=UPI001F042F63|nr:hemicentin-1-like [Xenia sp. Carnegie-2017]